MPSPGACERRSTRANALGIAAPLLRSNDLRRRHMVHAIPQLYFRTQRTFALLYYSDTFAFLMSPFRVSSASSRALNDQHPFRDGFNSRSARLRHSRVARGRD